METSKTLKLFQKAILILMIAMALIFAVIYFVANSRVGFEYLGAILVPSRDNGSTVYSGKIQGQAASFTVSADKTVVFQCGSKTYGPYTAREDPSAVPQGKEMTKYMTGVELREGDKILFRGGLLKNGDSISLYSEDGTPNIEMSSGVASQEPPVSTILKLMNGPKLTHKGAWIVWFGAVFLCGLNAIAILFADELFSWRVGLRVRNAEYAEPSDLEITMRCICWTVVTIIAFGLFMFGLR